MVSRIFCAPVLLAATLATVATVVPRSVHGEFYKWTDETGQARISNIPPKGIREDGTILDTYHPNSIMAQHARMRKQLEQQAVDIEHAEAAAKNDRRGGLAPFPLDILDGFGK